MAAQIGFYLKNPTFAKPIMIWKILRIFTNFKRRNLVQYIIFVFEIFQNGGYFEDGV
jgi:hypothetical protein